MSHRTWKIVIGVLATLLLLAVIGAAGVYAFVQYRTERYLQHGNEAFANRQWGVARANFAWYLTKHPDNETVLSQYAEASSKILDNRHAALRDMGRAYFQMATRDPDDEDKISTVLRFYETHRFWVELEYAASYFLRSRPQAAAAQDAGNGSQRFYDRLLYSKALGLDRTGRQKEAIDTYSLIVERGTDMIDAYGNLATLLRVQGFVEQAEAVLAKAAEQHPNDPRVHLQRARYLIEARDLAGAEKEIGPALQGLPDDVDSLLTAAQIAAAQKKWPEAAQFSEKAMALAPDRPETYLETALVYENQGNPDKAIALFQGIDRYVRADYPGLFMAQAEELIVNNRLDEAHEAIDAFRKAYPEYYGAFEYLAARELLVQSHDPASAAEAAKKFANVVESNPDNAQAQLYQAVALLQANRPSEAQTALESYLQAHPADDRARALWTSRFGGPKSLEEAEALGRAVLADAGSAPEALRNTAMQVMRLSGNGTKDSPAQGLVRQLLDKAIELEPAVPASYDIFSDWLLESKDTAAGQRALDRAEATGIAKSQLTHLRGALAVVTGDWKAAQAAFQEDIDLPESTDAGILRWAQLFARSGRLDLGLAALDTAAQRKPEDKRTDTELEKVGLCALAGETDQGIELIRQLAPRIQSESSSQGRLNEAKLALVRAVLRDTGKRTAQDLDRADQLLAEVEQADAQSPATPLLRAQLCLQRATPDYAQAEVAANAALERDPTNPEALQVLYGLMNRKGNGARAIEYAQKLAAGSPQNAGAQIILGEALMRLQRHREARQVLEGVLGMNPNNTQAMEMLVHVYGDSGQTREAKAMFDRLEKVLGNSPNKDQTLAKLRGWVSAYEGDWTGAEKDLRAQHEAHPTDVGVLQGLANAMAHQNRQPEAEQLLKQFAEQQASSPEAWTVLGQFYLATANPPNLAEASSAFTRATFLTADFTPALRGLIEIQLRSGNAGTALSLCERYLAAQPDDVEVLRQKALLLAREPQRLNDALAAIERAIQITERPEFFSVRGTVQLGLGNYSAAVSDLRRFTDAQKAASAQIDLEMAEGYLGMKECDLARQYCTSAEQKSAKGDALDATQLRRIQQRLETECGAKS